MGSHEGLIFRVVVIIASSIKWSNANRRRAMAEKIEDLNCWVMKKITFLLAVIIVMISATTSKATGISVSFSTKAYWSNTPPAGCLDRPRGWCFHISVDLDGILGVINNTGGVLVLTFDKKAISTDQYSQIFKDGKFYLDGEGTFSEELLKKLNLPTGFVLKPGYYQSEQIGEYFKVFFK